MKDFSMNTKKFLSSLLLCVLVAAMALFGAGCKDGKDGSANDAPETKAPTDSAQSTETKENVSNGNVLGEGSTVFSLRVTYKDGSEDVFEIHTDKTTVGEALLDLGLIAGEDGGYGLYVKTVNGVTADYDTDGTYWAFFINGDMAMSGADATDIEPGAEYGFKVS